MTDSQKAALKRIYKTARKLKKHSVMSYEQSKAKIMLLFLKPTEYEDSIRTVSRILEY